MGRPVTEEQQRQTPLPTTVRRMTMKTARPLRCASVRYRNGYPKSSRKLRNFSQVFEKRSPSRSVPNDNVYETAK